MNLKNFKLKGLYGIKDADSEKIIFPADKAYEYDTYDNGCVVSYLQEECFLFTKI